MTKTKTLIEILRAVADDQYEKADREHAERKAKQATAALFEIDMAPSEAESVAMGLDAAADIIEALDVPTPRSMDEAFTIARGVHAITVLEEAYLKYATLPERVFMEKVRRDYPNPSLEQFVRMVNYE